jgi:hypothetical protein
MKIAREVIQATEDQQAELGDHVAQVEKKYVIGAEIVQLASDLLQPLLGGVGFTGLPTMIQGIMQDRQTRRLIEQDYYAKPQAARNTGFAGVMNKMALQLLENIITAPATKLKLLAARQMAAAAAKNSSTFHETSAAKSSVLPPRPARSMKARAPVDEDEEDDDDDTNNSLKKNAPPTMMASPVHKVEETKETKETKDINETDERGNDVKEKEKEKAMAEEVYDVVDENTQESMLEKAFPQISEEKITPGPVLSGAAMEQLQNLTKITGAAQAANNKMKEVDAKTKRAAIQRQQLHNAQLAMIERQMDMDVESR